MSKHAGNRTGRAAKRRRARHERRVIHSKAWRYALKRAAAQMEWMLGDIRQRVIEIRVPPNLEAFARASFNTDRLIVDPAMGRNQIAVTPLAYAENITCEIGFQNPKELN